MHQFTSKELSENDFALFFVLALTIFLVGSFGTSQNKPSNQVSIFNSLFSITCAFIIASENFNCVAKVLFNCYLGKNVSLPCLFQVLIPSGVSKSFSFYNIDQRNAK